MTGCLQLKIALFSIFALLFAFSPATAGEPSNSCRRDDWIICTRHLPEPKNRCGISNEMRYWRRSDRKWVGSSPGEFISTLDPDTTLCVFVDGNKIEAEEADYRGKILRRNINSSGKRLRYVVWSWPSDQIVGRPVRDARTKIARANGDAYYLASWLSTLPSNQPTTLVGYSLGARTVSGAIHMLEGGTFDSNSIGQSTSPVSPRILFLGAAIPSRWIREKGENSLLLQGTERVLSIFNSKDRVLRLFKYDRSPDGGVVIGYRPISSDILGPFMGMFDQRDVSSIVRKSHGLQYYVDATGPTVISQFVFGSDQF